MRRWLFRTLIIALLAPATAAPAAASQGTPQVPGLAELGLPELTVTVDDSTISGLPTELAANRYLVHVTAGGSAATGIEFARPEGMAMDDFIAALATLHGGHEHGAATDSHEDATATGADNHGDDHGTATDNHDMGAMDATAQSSENMPGMAEGPSPVFNATFAGGIILEPGTTADVIVDLAAGEWVATGGPDAPQQPITFTVTGEMPEDLPEPAADATLTMGEYVIQVTEGELGSGPHLIKIENIGAQPHLVDISRSSIDTTRDAVLAAIGADDAGTPAPGDRFDINADLQHVVTTTTQSHGMTIWVAVALEPGTYVLQCHFPDIQDGRTHAVHGMVNVITVAD